MPQPASRPCQIRHSTQRNAAVPAATGINRSLLFPLTQRGRRSTSMVRTLPPFWAGFGWSCIKMPAEQIWVICAGAAATRLVDVTRSVNAEWTNKAAAAAGNRGSRAHSATVSSLVTHSG